MDTPNKSDTPNFGPLDPLMGDPSVSEIMVNGPKNVYVVRRGITICTEVEFENNEHIIRILQHILVPLGYRVDGSSPIVEASLPDGTLLVAVTPPVVFAGPTIIIRKLSKYSLKIDDLIRYGSITPEIAEFIRACIISRLNIIVSGGVGSGKLTFLNVLCSLIPDDERIVTVERFAELQLHQEHLINLIARPTDAQSKGQVSLQELFTVAMKMRPDRIVFGECLGGEALDMLQAINLGHEGSMTSVHSNNPRDCLTRLEKMCLTSDVNLPIQHIREQITTAVDLIVQINRLRDGSRKITHVTEVQGMEGHQIITSDIFSFEQTGLEQGKIIGRIRPTGIQPNFMERIESAGIQLPPEIFHIPSRRRYIPRWLGRR